MGDTKSSHVWRNLAIVGAVLAVFVAVAIALTPKRTDDTDWVRRQAALDAAQARQALEQPWSYGRNSDPQRDGFMFEAFTPSLKEIVQKPPKPSSIVYLTVRTEAKTGLVAYIDFPRDTNWKCSLQGCNSTPVRGVIVCAAEGCRAPVRFDDAPAKPYDAIGPADHSAGTIFIRDAAGFLARLKKSKTVTVTLAIGGAGTQDVTFNTRNLKWQDLPAKS